MVTSTSDANAEPRKRFALGWLVTFLLIAHGGTLALKAWEDRQTNNLAELTTLQRTALAVQERLDGRADKVNAAMELLEFETLSAEKIAARYNEIDTVSWLTDANVAEANSRLRIAAETVFQNRHNSGPLFVTQAGDIVLLSNINGRDAIAIGSPDVWLPTQTGDYHFSLTGPGRIGIGNTQLAAMTTGLTHTDPHIVNENGLPRTGIACSRLQSSAISLCALKPIPMISNSDLIRSLIYLLLLIAPGLAIFGLYKKFTSQAGKVEHALKVERGATHLMNLTMEGAQAGFWELRSDTNIIKVSEQMARLIGRADGGEMPLHQVLDYVYDSDRDNVATAFERAIETRTLNVAFRPQHDARNKWIELSGREVKDHNDTYIHFAGIAADITERKSTDDRLSMAERRLRNAIEGYDGPFAIWDHRKRLLYWNSAYSRCFNLEKELREGMSYSTVALATAPAIRQDTPSTTEPNTSLVNLTSGRWYKFVERATPEGGRITVGVDVTESTLGTSQLNRQKQKLKRLVAELERSEGQAAGLAKKYAEEKERAERAANSKSAFLANMSHELRTPLNAINGFSEILSSELYGSLGDPRYKEYANDILMSGKHLLDMINDVLDMAKIEAGKMSVELLNIDPVDPVDAAVRMIRRSAEDKGIRVIFDPEEGLPAIEGDHRAIRQMVLNLISNAIKFTDEGGRIAVTIRQRGDMLRIAVTDTGIGIPEEDLSRLGKPFEQVNDTSNRNYEGTGLGLALTKSFAEMHGGKLSIASQVGRGTMVAIYLPIRGSGTQQNEGYKVPAE